MKLRGWMCAVAIAGTVGAVPAQANLVLSEVIVDLAPGHPSRDDIEALNTGADRMYLVADPFEVIDPGRPSERRVVATNPQSNGLIVTPQRMILEPGERRLIRVAAIAPRGSVDRVYRVAIRPVAGAIAGAQSGVKVMIGYDILVILRPSAPQAKIVASRNGAKLTLENVGNTNAELFDGKECDAAGVRCQPLPGQRLYAGAAMTIPVAGLGNVQYQVRVGNAVMSQKF